MVEKHAQTMLQLLEFGKRGMSWETWRTGAEREYSSFTDYGRVCRGEQILDCVEQYPEPPLCVKSASPDTENHDKNGYAKLYDDNNIFMTNVDNNYSDMTYTNKHKNTEYNMRDTDE